jgi:hypothetical protein
MPERPLPTKSICDLIDQIRHDAVALISLQNAIIKKEKEMGQVKQLALASKSESSGQFEVQSKDGQKKLPLPKLLSNYKPEDGAEYSLSFFFSR